MVFSAVFKIYTGATEWWLVNFVWFTPIHSSRCTFAPNLLHKDVLSS